MRFLVSNKIQLTKAHKKDYYFSETENTLEFLKRILNT